MIKINQKGFAPIIIILGIVLILGVIVGAYFFGKTAYLKLHCPFGIIVNNECGWNWAPPLSSIQPSTTFVPTVTLKACTQEAKICPDGSSVGRTGPNCEFGSCPHIPDVINLAEQDLASTLSIDLSKIILNNYSKVQWRDGSLGCPKAGFVYTQIIIAGYKVIFMVDQKQYEYHTDLGNEFILCQQEIITEGKSCGGFAGETGQRACPAGYYCKYPEPVYPDASGKCTKR